MYCSFCGPANSEALRLTKDNPKIPSLYYFVARDNDDLHQFRMKIVDSHYQTGISMSVFYFLFVKYSNFLFKDMDLTHEEVVVNNRVLSYELHFISNLKMR